MSAASEIGVAKRNKQLTAASTEGRMRIDSHPPDRQKSQEHKMDEGNEQSFRRSASHLLGHTAGKRRTTLLEKPRHSCNGVRFQPHVCINKD